MDKIDRVMIQEIQAEQMKEGVKNNPQAKAKSFT